MSPASHSIPGKGRADFERVALPFLPEIYRTAVGLLGNRTEAKDLAQDVFLQAWKSFDQFEPGTNMRAWLHKILVFRASHFRRKFWRFATFGNKEEETQDIPVNDAVPDHLSDKQVMEALAAVPPRSKKRWYWRMYASSLIRRSRQC